MPHRQEQLQKIFIIRFWWEWQGEGCDWAELKKEREHIMSSKVWVVIALITISLSAGVALVLAQEPLPQVDSNTQSALGTIFTYQGQLKSGGNPVNGKCDFQFSLWDAVTDGTQIGTTQTKSNVSVSNGLFTTSLDFGSAFTGDARWLAVAVRCPARGGSYTPLSPRQALTAAPYALYSKAAPWSGLSGMPAGFADGVDNDTTYTAGTGLTLAGTQFSVNTSVIQSCVTGTCSSGNAIRVVNADGTVTCEPVAGGAGDITAVYAGTGLTGGGTWGDVTLSVDFAGSGSATTVARSDHNHDAAYWRLTGNSGTNPTTHFLGTADNQALELRVNSARVLRLEPNTTSPNVIGGYSGNSVTDGRAGATIGGGGTWDLNDPDNTNNRVTDNYGAVGGGGGNRAGNGDSDTTNARYATVPGGASNVAGGAYSFAAGRRAKAYNQGCFVLADATDADEPCVNDNRFVFRVTNGFYIWTTANHTAGVLLPTGGNAWSNLSDRAAKENFAPVDGRDLLARLAAIPIQTWNYRSQDPAIRHIGPVAQDFYAAFGVGEDDTHISTVDADGVVLAAIQGLYERSQEQEARIAQLEQENAALRSRLDSLEARLAALERQAGGAPDPASALPISGLALGGLALLGAAAYRRREEGGKG